ncbi:MFS transporter, partial [Faecalibacterium hattorii]|uniref:MFS transporter n=1 Tax=Faecalibacterium hattorii TaxID=2935520 RepID=UPI003AB0DB1C
MYPSIQSCAQKWYKGRKGLATGVIGGAVGLSGAFLTVFVRTALKGFGPVQGIRGAFWALGALTLPVCFGGSMLLVDPPPEKPKPEQQGKAKRLRRWIWPLCRCSARSNTGSAPGAICFS